MDVACGNSVVAVLLQDKRWLWVGWYSARHAAQDRKTIDQPLRADRLNEETVMPDSSLYARLVVLRGLDKSSKMWSQPISTIRWWARDFKKSKTSTI